MIARIRAQELEETVKDVNIPSTRLTIGTQIPNAFPNVERKNDPNAIVSKSCACL